MESLNGGDETTRFRMNPGGGEGQDGSWLLPFLANEYDRVASLREHAILDTPPDPHLDSLVEAAARELGMPISRISLIDSTREWTKSAFGTRAGASIPRALAFCSHTILNPGSLTIVPDASTDPRFASNPIVAGEPRIRFYAGAPLTDVEGHVLGALSVMDTRPRSLDVDGCAKLSFLAGVASSRIELYRVNEALLESEAHYRSAVDLNPQIPWTALPNGSVEEASPRWLDLTGMSPEHARGGGWTEALHQDDFTPTMDAWRKALDTGEKFSFEYRLRTRNGSYRWCRVHAAARRNMRGEILRWYGTVEDIHDRKTAETALRQSEQRLRFALEVGGLGAWEYDVNSGRVTASDLCAQAFGLQRGEDLASYDDVLMALNADDRAILETERQRVFSSDHFMDVELRAIWPDQTLHWVRLTGRAIKETEGQPTRAFGLAVNVTEQRQAKCERERTQERLVHLANHDALTGLANRRLLDSQLTQAIDSATPEAQAALISIDLDQFKLFNDRFGHEAGDQLLRQVAQRLLDCVRKCDTVARQGGDEFAIVLAGVDGPRQVESFVRRIFQSFTMPFDIAGRMTVLGATIGVSLAPNDTREPGQLRRNADTALYRAKAAGRGMHRFFEPGMDVSSQRREQLKGELQDAMTLEQLSLFYQPIVDLQTGRVSGFEALMRWINPERGMISPDDFIPLAEETGLVSRLGRWALRKACRDAASWPSQIRVAVNLSVVQFSASQLESEVAEALAEAGLAPARLELEVTERLLLQDSESNMKTLDGLRSLGVHLVMDDFGTGYSSLAYLRRFKFDKIKVDKSLVMGLPDANGGDTIVKAIIALGRSLGIGITAEGIESHAQLKFLRQNSCAQGQGYLFSEPVPFNRTARLLEQTWPG